MAVWLAITVGGLYGCAFYMLMRRSITKTLIGLILLSNAANLLIFVAAGLTEAQPALIPADSYLPEPGTADPLAQALILTAIVIGFGVLAFAMALIYRAHEVLHVDDFDALKDADE
ncbi:NADH-quinone oxidoreductase subunit K [Algiphilus sp.]|uniref:NADH-quinone oxidoreductase subunit K n=1 Tax=Algiphilus sp. TaxID=1872431 RepID=UPI001CA61AB5|nr:NADH-quinone oxidoreductase subunit K [Algiphilus sp.]MBY8964553.1 NADH-quinone oxidoreductase subunit K [Algiphilus acroporae]MCI5063278.1 NADH-quinone oxidoreductase subunit K [Algiphilus sp.]MCI5102339.1 NADH-quinone oxidoreductase subunit K [Algiphilus sp.]